MKFDLNNKVAIVTGASQGIGETIAVEMANSGAYVICLARNKNALDSTINIIEKNGKQAVAHSCDISDNDQFNQIVKSVIDEHGKIDILVNNAGIAGPNFKTWDYPLEEWQKVIDIDLSGVFYCCKTIVPHFIKHNYGRIVNISSIAGKEGNPNAMPYSCLLYTSPSPRDS